MNISGAIFTGNITLQGSVSSSAQTISGGISNSINTLNPVDTVYYTEAVWGSIEGTLVDQGDLMDALNAKANVTDLEVKQDTLVSGRNIKTINGNSLLGSGDIPDIGVNRIANTDIEVILNS